MLMIIVQQRPTADFGHVVVDLAAVAGPYLIDYPTANKQTSNMLASSELAFPRTIMGIKSRSKIQLHHEDGIEL